MSAGSLLGVFLCYCTNCSKKNKIINRHHSKWKYPVSDFNFLLFQFNWILPQIFAWRHHKRPADAMESVVSELNPPWHSNEMKTLYHEHSLECNCGTISQGLIFQK